MISEPTRGRFPFGPGTITCDLHDGAPVRVEHPDHPAATFLLDERDADWHHAPFRWGKGFLISDAGAARWDHPASLHLEDNGFTLIYEPLPGLELSVQRRFGARWAERYSLTNHSATPLTLSSFAIATPFRDVYHNAAESLAGCCNAHIWTGGAWAYVWAVPMSGQAPGLGMALTEGELWAYSLETRNPYPKGHNRGHIYLHLTDAARAPHAMGGQPSFVLAPGAHYSLAWELGWFPDHAAFEAALCPPPLALPALSATVGTPLRLEPRTPTNLTLHAPASLQVTEAPGGAFDVSSQQQGVSHLDLAWEGRRARIGLLFQHPLRQLVEQRATFILERQRANERADDRRGAFLAYDTRWGLRLNGGNWLDWSDARERIGMPILLQELRLRGWGDQAQIDTALAEFEHFCRAHLVAEDGTVFEHSYQRLPNRLYNFPWLADFYLGQFKLYQQPADLELATRIVERYYALGGEKFLAIGMGEVVEDLIEALKGTEMPERAATLTRLLLAHADHFVALGTDLPSHEVHYEQSIVAPLLSLLISAQRLDQGRGYDVALATRLPWLLAFGGPQPHARLRNIAIRHWDGYWFGALRRWGDVFPHYWSALSAVVLARWPADLPTPGVARLALAREILAANLADYGDDGSASCAFVFPSFVDGNPAHSPDPLANDQDWGLVFALRYGKAVQFSIE
jgi:hypothetical protein